MSRIVNSGSGQEMRRLLGAVARAASFLVVLLSILATNRAYSQPVCEDTPEGRICRVQQPIVGGNAVDVHLQRELGLVTVNGGCSGTLLNQFWVLTARHCVTTTGQVDHPLLPPNQISVTAAWAGGRIVVASKFVEMSVNTGPG